MEKLFASKGNDFIESRDPMHGLPWIAAAMEQASDNGLANRVHRVPLQPRIRGIRLSHFSPSSNISSSPIVADSRSWHLAPEENKAVILNLAASSGQVTMLPHPQPVFQCAFSPHGQRLATSSTDGYVRIWRTSALASAPLLS